MGLFNPASPTASLLSSLKRSAETIPLHRLSNERYVLYRSAIAFKLAPLLQLSPLEIANQLTAALPAMSPETTCQLGLDFSVEVVSPGWINFRLSDRGLATWLQQATEGWELKTREGSQHLLPTPAENAARTAFCVPSSELNPNCSQSLFPIQYVHARCCSLLRLAHEQDLIRLRDLDFKTLNCQFIKPNPIPWFDEASGAGLEQISLRLVHPAEQRLIGQMIDIRDAISEPSQINGVKLANALSNAFEEFYRYCRIWGEVKTQSQKLAQARLGLVGVTQPLLRHLLQDYLGALAPKAL